MQPLNLGSTEMVSMNEMMELASGFEGKALPIKHIPGPEGVRGRNSENSLILSQLGWEPTVKLADGLKLTYFWIKKQVWPRRNPHREFHRELLMFPHRWRLLPDQELL